ncbi:hypothetical protein WH06_01955 [Aeromonas salmonicida subsp. salmonicida]|uniref:Phage protein n=1 Tax=Aeromonas salmonicida subsp. salmonicida 01-B526 TaxID=1076135 RepID=A0ABP2N5N3_AERSS|nr:hypothetical protein IYQ_00917 [Aeromonas salmonicida subsp. salmonicida 01-B526]OKA83854.1 hypothetical protein BHR40_03460 [Aeromonas salmonicida subsp. salmonicida]OSM53938.1 hypothetical protein WH06_01955 [Aeromonas salmonicida subsp. salmonicida]
MNLLAGVGCLVKAVLSKFVGFQAVLIREPADGLGADPQLLAKFGCAPELAGYPGCFDRQIEVSQDAAYLGELGRSGKGGGSNGADQIIEQLAVLVDGQLKLLHWRGPPVPEDGAPIELKEGPLLELNAERISIERFTTQRIISGHTSSGMELELKPLLD